MGSKAAAIPGPASSLARRGGRVRRARPLGASCVSDTSKLQTRILNRTSVMSKQIGTSLAHLPEPEEASVQTGDKEVCEAFGGVRQATTTVCGGGGIVPPQRPCRNQSSKTSGIRWCCGKRSKSNYAGKCAKQDHQSAKPRRMKSTSPRGPHESFAAKSTKTLTDRAVQAHEWTHL